MVLNYAYGLFRPAELQQEPNVFIKTKRVDPQQQIWPIFSQSEEYGNGKLTNIDIGSTWAVNDALEAIQVQLNSREKISQQCKKRIEEQYPNL